jgi:translation initiation factor IF-3
MDLVEVAPMERPPVCKIMDYGKWRYQQQKKQDKSRAANRGGQLKELIFKTVKIGVHDLMIKVNHAREFLKEGNKVQFTLRFKGREMAHLDLGRELFVKVKQELFYVSKVERDAKMEGRRMTLVLQPDHKDPNTKMPANITASPSRPPPGPPRGPVGGGLNRSAPAAAGSGLNLPPRPAAAAAAAAPVTAGAAPAPAAPRTAPAPAASQSA